MERNVYQWLNKNIECYYQFVRALKKGEKKEVLLYRHKEMQQGIVVKKLCGIYPAYEHLLHVRGKYLAGVKEVANDGEHTLIVEEYVDGISLADMLQTQKISEKRAIEIGLQVCDALYVLHENRIIHRDIKPENIMILPSDEIKVIDFDAARLYKSFESKDTVMLGTIGYAAPEQYGEAQTDERTDIYAMGILLNVMLTGKHPVNEMVDGEIGSIIEKCIMVDPKKRYKNILELKTKLKNVQH